MHLILCKCDGTCLDWPGVDTALTRRDRRHDTAAPTHAACDDRRDTPTLFTVMSALFVRGSCDADVE